MGDVWGLRTWGGNTYLVHTCSSSDKLLFPHRVGGVKGGLFKAQPTTHPHVIVLQVHVAQDNLSCDATRCATVSCASL